MLTIDQIQTAFAKVKSGADFPQFVQDLAAMGVTHYDTYVIDGRTTYFGAGDYAVAAEATYPALPGSAEASAALVKQAIALQRQGQADYPTFCTQVAAAGVHK
jgi:uncharacterized protein YbcV (DUF1398 family)